MGKAITLMAKIIYKSLNRLYQTLFIGYILPKPLYFVDIKAPIDEIVSYQHFCYKNAFCMRIYTAATQPLRANILHMSEPATLMKANSL